MRLPRCILAAGAVTLCLLIAGRELAAQTSDTAARDEMIRLVELETLLTSAETGIRQIDPRVLDAMREVPRHAFLPEPLQPYAYGNHPLPLGHDQNLAAPLLAALMTHLAAVEPGDVVFETGTDIGYQAALLGQLAAEVYSVEVVEPLAEAAAQLLEEMQYDNVHTRAADGYYGWPEEGPYDAMIIKEAIDHVPVPLLNQLGPGGRMVLPLGPPAGPQFLTVVTKDAEGRVTERRVMPVRFSPLQGGQRL